MSTAVGVQAPAFKRVVVPLDGSAAAEEILPHLVRMKGAIDEMLLLHVVPLVTLSPTAATEAQARLGLQAEKYLMRVYDLVPRSRVRLRVETGDASERILAVLNEVEADLLAMTPHSKSGLGPVFFGGTARRLLKSIDIPILLAKPGLPRPSKSIERILVPIGTEAGEETLLEPVVRLAKCLHSELTLLRANAIIVSQDPVTGLVLPLPTRQARAELAPSLEQLSRSHPGVPTQVLSVQGDVAPTILDQARRMQADLVAMTTHARIGFDRILSGSFAEEVLRGIHTPVLLQHLRAHDSRN
ncbi:MAG TPA: universal stress protein [Planctomycetota bacterium]|nr:universal stress protein [Planctomycetota bacterium]